jgi:hypothetical protein
MSLSVAIRIGWMGFVTWIVPLAISFAFYGKDGQLQIPLGTFKSIMFVSGTAVAVGMLILLFRNGALVRHAGLVTGIAWLAINIVLDLLVLVAGFGMSLGTYFSTIGLGYLAIPILTFGAERLASGATRT